MLQNVQPNWNETDSTSDAFIKNKPTIPAAQVQSDWDESDSSDVAFIKGKPALATVATTGSYNDLSNKPNIAPDGNDYLCFTATEDNTTVRLDKKNQKVIFLEYSTDKSTWADYSWNSGNGAGLELMLNAGEKVYFRGDNDSLSDESTGRYQFYFNKNVYASGNIMSLLDKKCEKLEAGYRCFQYLFYDCPLLTAPKLPAVKIGGYCYSNMFWNNKVLKTAPELPATTIGENCYGAIFDGCSALVVPPPILPATVLKDRCYSAMFRDTAIEESPYLPATPSSNLYFPYEFMFAGCSHLKYIKVGLTSWNEGRLFAMNWFDASTSQTGIFECSSALDMSIRDNSHVPAGWTIVRTDAPNSDWSQTDTTEASYVKNRGISTETAVSNATYTINAGGATTPVLTVASALTLSAGTVASGKIAYAEVVLDVAAGATVTAGSNITFVDTLTAGKRNVCVVRWSGGTAKMYVCITEDLPQA